MEGIPMPKTGQKNASPREDATEASVGRVAVPKTGKSISTLPGLKRSAGRSPHWDASEVPVGRVPVPRTDRDRREKPI